MIKKLAITAIASLSLFASVSHAWMYPYYPTMGNVCRTYNAYNAYNAYSMIAPMPVGASCWNYGWNMPGVVSTW